MARSGIRPPPCSLSSRGPPGPAATPRCSTGTQVRKAGLAACAGNDWPRNHASPLDAPVQSALRMALLDDRRQLGLTGDRENDIADAPRWFIDRGAGDLRSEEQPSELQSLMRI